MKRVILFVYEWLIAIPLLVSFTIFTALFTLCTIPWRNSPLVHGVQQLWSRSFFWLFFMNVEVEGVENIQKGQSYVFVANHESMFDIWMVYGWLPVVFKWIMKQELRKVPLVGIACKGAGHIFIDRRHVKAALQSIREAKKILVDGVSVVIFPEGTRSETGEVAPFKRGAFQIAFDMQLPVVPLSLIGPRSILPKGKILVSRAKKLKLVIGKPMDLSVYKAEDPDNHQSVLAAEHEAMNAVREQVILGKERG